MIVFTLVLIAATLGYALATRLHLPPFPFLVLGGLGLAQSGLVTDTKVIQDYLMLGLCFLVFSSGIELNPRRAGSQVRLAVVVGVLQFVALGLAGWGLAGVFNFHGKEAMYVGVALAASSTLVVVRLLQRRRQLFEPFGRLVVGVLLVQDLLVILSIGALHRELLTGMGAAVVLLCLTFVLTKWISPRLVLRYQFDEETLLLVCLSYLFIFLGLGYFGNLPPVVGAFLAGVALSEFPVDGVVQGHLKTINVFFNVLFFTCLGALLTFELKTFVMALTLAGAVLVLTPLVVIILAERAGLMAKSAIESGMLLSQTSEFSLVIALIGLADGDIRPSTFSVLVLLTVLTMLWTPAISSERVVNFLVKFQWTRRRSEVGSELKEHAVVLGAGDTGSAIAQALHERGMTVVVVDDDPLALESLEKVGVSVLRGDGSDQDVLEAAGVERAKLVVSTLRRLQDHLTVLSYTKKVPTWVRVFEPSDADKVKAEGGNAIVVSEASSERLLLWFDQKFGSKPPGSGRQSEPPPLSSPTTEPDKA